MDWSKIIALVLPLILDCLKERGRDEIKDNLRGGRLSGRQVLRLRGELRRKGMNRQEINAAVDEVQDELKKATDEELDALLDEAEAA